MRLYVGVTCLLHTARYQWHTQGLLGRWPRNMLYTSCCRWNCAGTAQHITEPTPNTANIYTKGQVGDQSCGHTEWHMDSVMQIDSCAARDARATERTRRTDSGIGPGPIPLYPSLVSPTHRHRAVLNNATLPGQCPAGASACTRSYLMMPGCSTHPQLQRDAEAAGTLQVSALEPW